MNHLIAHALVDRIPCWHDVDMGDPIPHLCGPRWRELPTPMNSTSVSLGNLVPSPIFQWSGIGGASFTVGSGGGVWDE